MSTDRAEQGEPGAVGDDGLELTDCNSKFSLRVVATGCCVRQASSLLIPFLIAKYASNAVMTTLIADIEC